ncbi:MAG: 50S ribosomal protein L19 [Spirochaetes bacterium RBG_13_68_11]|nr:MAG: 50S ribosomal protein L19 [Spirochaetes bacterium RBG_13_68_11]
MDAIRAIEAEQLKAEPGEFRIGDTVRVHFKIIEGKTERVQVFEGIVIARKRAGLNETFTVRKISYGVGVERVFPLHSPKIVKVVRVREGRVRRSKLYYLRGRTGKAAKVNQLIRRKRTAVVPETGSAETVSSTAEPAGQPEQ